MAKLWRIQRHDPERIRRLERSAGVSAVLAQLLVCRGLEDPQQARDFLEIKLSHLRDPSELPGVNEAAQRIGAAITARHRIVVYGDYDVDGISGAALLWQCLRLLGGDVGHYVPHRIDEGYGLHRDALTNLAEQGAKLIVTVDCGIASADEADHAAELGLELVITDHHQPGERLPRASAIVHPDLPGRPYPFSGLSGAGVAFKLAWALCQQASGAKKVGEAMKQFLLGAVGLAALGTVADVVPMLDENRVLVQRGLTSLREFPSLGMSALMRVTQLDKKQQLDSEDIGFMLAPRLNAAGRLGQAQLAFELLTTSSAERAQALAEYVHELNSSRQSLERSIYLAANKQAQEDFDPENDAALVLAGRGWHPGVIGIVAGRLAEKFHRPVVLVSLDELSLKPGIGSARSVPGFNLHAALAACSEHLISHGGHAAAAGLKVAECSLDGFRLAFNEHALTEIASEERSAELWIDAEVPLGSLTMEAVRQMERLAPFGHRNPRPLLCATDVTLASPPKPLGSGGRHLSVQLQQASVRLRAVAFGAGERAEELAKTTEPLSVAFRPVINHFQGRSKVELQIVDWRVAQAAHVHS